MNLQQGHLSLEVNVVRDVLNKDIIPRTHKITIGRFIFTLQIDSPDDDGLQKDNLYAKIQVSYMGIAETFWKIDCLFNEINIHFSSDSEKDKACNDQDFTFTRETTVFSFNIPVTRQDETVEVSMDVEISEMDGAFKLPFNFLSESLTNWDVMVECGPSKEVLYCHRSILLYHSVAFETQLEEVEPEKYKLKLPDHDVMEVFELVDIIYNRHARVRSENVEILLPLAYKFKFGWLLDEIEKFLMTKVEQLMKEDNKKPFDDILFQACKYGLINLRIRCMATVTRDHFEGISDREEYKTMHTQDKLALNEQLLDSLSAK